MRIILFLFVCSCSSEKPTMDASAMDASVLDVKEAASNCVAKGGSCKDDAGNYQVSLCCSGNCALGSVNTGTCE